MGENRECVRIEGFWASAMEENCDVPLFPALLIIYTSHRSCVTACVRGTACTCVCDFVPPPPSFQIFPLFFFSRKCENPRLGRRFSEMSHQQDASIQVSRWKGEMRRVCGREREEGGRGRGVEFCSQHGLDHTVCT